MRSMTRSAGVDNQVVRERRAGGAGKPARRLFKTLSTIPTIDKMTEPEKFLAAAISAAAQKHGLAFDGGEALLDILDQPADMLRGDSRRGELCGGASIIFA